MRILIQEGITTQCTEIRHSHSAKKNIHGQLHQFTSNGLGKTQNLDFEPLHAKDL